MNNSQTFGGDPLWRENERIDGCTVSNGGHRKRMAAGAPDSNVTPTYRPQRIAGTLSLCALLCVALIASAIVATPVHAAVQGGTCTAFQGAVPLGAAYSDSVATVPACGPRPYPAGPQLNVYPYLGAPRATPGYQCVEFSERFIYYRFGLGAPGSRINGQLNPATDGDRVVDQYSALYPSKFTVEDASDAVELAQGDVLSLAHTSTFSDGFGGHTSVVQSSTVSSSGTGQITVIEENASPKGTSTFNVQGWKIQGTGYTYIKWLHFNGLPVTSPGPGPSARPVDLVFAIDTTGSMSPYISSVVAASSTIVNLLDTAHADYRIGVVDYKDSDYGCPDYDAVTDLGFSTDKSTILAALASLQGKIYGGCDTPEDVYSGISRALGFPWRHGVTKAVIFMGDAPGHDPEPHSGLTLASIKAQAAAVDPAQAYAVLVGADVTAHQFDQAVADATGGQTFDATSDPSMAGAAFVTAIQTILNSLAPSSTTVTASSTAPVAGAPVQLQAAVAPGANSGSVTFLANGEPLLACHDVPVDVAGNVACTTPFTSAGTYDIEAVYSGNDTLATSTSAPVTLTVAGDCGIGVNLTGHLVIVAGQSACIGSGSVVAGGISVASGGSLYVYDATVQGRVAAQGPSAFVMCGTTANGGISVTDGEGPVDIGDVDGQLPCWGNTIKGSVAVNHNTAGVAVSDNDIRGSLSLLDNSGALPPPDTGSLDAQDNAVTGQTTIG